MRFAALRRAGLALVGTSVLVAPAVRAQADRVPDGVWALTNARIETVSHGTIERGTVVIRNGLIEAVGANVKAPADARVIDLAGRTVYPGIIDLTSTIGLPASPAAQQGGPGGGAAARLAAANQPSGPIGLEPSRDVASELAPALGDVRGARDAGVTAVLVSPARGAFRGLSALLPLRDSVGSRDVLRAPVALQMGFQSVPGRYPGTLLGVIAYERQAFYDAQRQGMLEERYRANPRGMERPEHDKDLEALVPVVRGAMPAFWEANSENDIRRAERVAKEFNLKVNIVGATEGFRAIDALKGGRPVIVSTNYPKAPEVTGWSYRTAQRHDMNDSARADAAARRIIEGNAAALHAAGIGIALASGGARPSEFLPNVRKAVAAGLPKDAALAALTMTPAQIVGMADALGSIDAGKIANLVVTDGDLFADATRVRTVIVDGVPYDVTAAPAVTVAGGGRGGRGQPTQVMQPAQVAGTWSLQVNTPQGANTATLNLVQNGSSLSGTMSSQLGEAAVTDGSIAGREIRWSITYTMNGQNVTIAFSGEVDGDRMTGSAQLGSLGTATFTGERKP